MKWMALSLYSLVCDALFSAVAGLIIGGLVYLVNPEMGRLIGVAVFMLELVHLRYADFSSDDDDDVG